MKRFEHKSDLESGSMHEKLKLFLNEQFGLKFECKKKEQNEKIFLCKHVLASININSEESILTFNELIRYVNLAHTDHLPYPAQFDIIDVPLSFFQL